MIKPRDFALDTFEACLVELTEAFALGGLTREEIRAALERRLRAFGSAAPARRFDPARQADGAEVFVEVPAQGGVDAG